MAQTQLKLGSVIRASWRWSVFSMERHQNHDAVKDREQDLLLTVECPAEGTHHGTANIASRTYRHEDSHYYNENIKSGKNVPRFNSFDRYPENEDVLDRKAKLVQRIKKAGICLTGKYFIITNIQGIGFSAYPVRGKPEEMKYEARECYKNGRVKKSGLTIQWGAFRHDEFDEGYFDETQLIVKRIVKQRSVVLGP